MTNQIKSTLYCFLLASLFTSTLIGQNLEIQGQAKITDLPDSPNPQKIVTHRSDNTLGTIPTASLLSSLADTRTLQSDLLLTSAICNCPILPPAMIQSLLANGYSIQDLIDFKLSPQNLLDVGVTPLDLLNGGAMTADFIGLNYQGGIIFYMNPNGDGTGLVAAPIDQVGGRWGCSGTQIGTGTAIGTGQANTTAIVNGCGTAGIAARVCDDLVFGGYNDWFLPSKDELNEMYLKIGGGATGSNQNIGGFSNIPYWSSSEISIDAWGQLFTDGQQGCYTKQDGYNVRAIRAF